MKILYSNISFKYINLVANEKAYEIITDKFVNTSKFATFDFPPRKIIQTLPLYNPTHETLELKMRNSNPENFVMDINKKTPVSTFRNP